MEKVSVIIPAYNRGHLIGETIKSVLGSTYEDIEVIVVDSGSTDNTKEVLKGLDVKKCYRKQKHSAASNRNYGLKKATGKYVLFLDSDDLISSHYIENAVRAFQNKKVNIVFSDYHIFIHHQMAEFSKEGMLKYDMIPSGSFARKSAIKQTFDEGLKFHEDYDFWLKLSRKGEVKKLNEPGFYYRSGPDNKSFASASPTLVHFIQERERLRLKRPLIGSVSIITPVCGQIEHTKRLIEQLNEVVLPFELILINNGDPKDMDHIRPAKHLEYTIIQNKENRGFPASVNQGITLSRGDYLFMMNNDIKFDKDFIPTMLLTLKEWDIVGPLMNNGTWTPAIYKGEFKKDPAKEKKIKKVHALSFACAAFKRELVEDKRVGLLNEQFGLGYHEDSLFCHQATKAGYKVGLIPYLKIFHYGGATVKELGLDKEELKKRNLPLFNKLAK